MVWQLILCGLLAYVIGSINPSYIIGAVKGLDIRKKGSGNAGASNAVIVLGAKAGVFSMIFDIAKAWAICFFAPWIFPQAVFAAEVAGTFVILGHVFPFYMKFKGGKGLACLGGAVLALDWRIFLIFLAAEFVVLFATNYLCFVPISAAVITPGVYMIKRAWLDPVASPWIGALIVGAGSAVIFCKHFKNLRRLAHGTEMRFSYVYSNEEKKEKEKDRIAANQRKWDEKKAMRANPEKEEAPRP